MHCLLVTLLVSLSVLGGALCDVDATLLLNDEQQESDSDARGHYTHEWAAEIHGGIEKCHEVAARHDFVCTGQVSLTGLTSLLKI